MKNIVVLVSGGGTNLRALIDAEKTTGLGGGKITCVISSKPDAYALTRAAENGIKSVVLERKSFSDVHEYSVAMAELLKAEKADLVVYAGFMTILDQTVCRAFPYKMMNVHPALIPSFCGKGFYGLHVHEAVLEKGVKLSGATVHFVTEECDGGPIILQKSVEVQKGDTPETLQKRIMEQCEWKILPQAVTLFCQDKIKIIDGKAVVEWNGVEEKIVVATKAIIGCNGKYLLIRRSGDDETGAGTWEFPGGKLDFGETMEQCILREIREETGLTAEILGLGYVTDFYTSPTRKIVLINYICRTDSEAVALSDEHTAYKWVKKDEILREIEGSIADSLRQYNVLDLL